MSIIEHVDFMDIKIEGLKRINLFTGKDDIFRKNLFDHIRTKHPSNKFLFIENIEQGFHYTAYRRIWELFDNISKEQGFQIFATTHSYEMITSLGNTIKNHEECTIIKLFRFLDKNSQEIDENGVAIITGEAINRVLESKLELR